MQRKIYWLFAAVLVVILSACGSGEPIHENNAGSVTTSSVAEAAVVTETQGKPLEDLLLAQGSAASVNDTEFIVRLVMTKGEYLTGNQVALGGGLADENYIGVCELQVWSGEKMLGIYALQGEAGQELVFNRIPFELKCGDYNGDGNPDFTVGQWASSTANVYTLFTVQEDGSIDLLTAPYSIFASDGKSNGEAYSIALTANGRSFTVSSYNNATGEMQPQVYGWDEAQGIFRLWD